MGRSGAGRGLADSDRDCLPVRQGQLYSIGIGRTHARTHVLVQDRNVRIINAATGELLRELELDPTVRYQPTGAPKGPTPKTIKA
jgi:hypothetical protein